MKLLLKQLVKRPVKTEKRATKVAKITVSNRSNFSLLAWVERVNKEARHELESF